MKLYKIPFFLLIKPRLVIKEVIETKFSLFSILLYMLVLNSIGPLLSIYSMYIKENLPIEKAVIYSVITYILDILSILIFSFFLSKTENNLSYKDSFQFSVIVYTPIWLSDIVDISQYLRPLSSLGLIYSLILLILLFKFLKKDKPYIFISLTVYIILYILDSLIAESIITNPILKKLLNI